MQFELVVTSLYFTDANAVRVEFANSLTGDATFYMRAVMTPDEARKCVIGQKMLVTTEIKTND